MKKPHSATSSVSSLPLVVQIGFAGARNLWDAAEHPDVDAAEFETQLVEDLTRRLRDLPKELGVDDKSLFFCGISQIAIGGDTVFTKACQAANIVQRVFLPQHLDTYLDAIGSSGHDFNVDQKKVVSELLESPHIIQHRLVSDSPDRRTRFRDANVEIARVSDLLICMTRVEQTSRAGGTHELIELGRNRQRPVLELQVAVGDDSKPVVTPVWHGREHFQCPQLPAELGTVTYGSRKPDELPNVNDYCNALKQLGSDQARWQKRLFGSAALIIIAAHILATIIAVVALKLHSGIVPWLLGTELVFLLVGFGVHQALHYTHSLGKWALHRLVAEVTRSVRQIGDFHVYLEHLFTLQFPFKMRPLLRTISVLHLHSTIGGVQDAWESKRDHYVEKRLVSAKEKAQIPYNQDTACRSGAWLRRARDAFLTASSMAFLATLTKLLTLCHCLPLEHEPAEIVANIAGAFAVVLPVLAVAALSLAAAFDVEAKFHAAEEMLKFLEQQRTLLKSASTEREFSRLLIETESRILGETVNWFSRRCFIGVA